jgi:hypothetical protein
MKRKKLKIKLLNIYNLRTKMKEKKNLRDPGET